MQRLMQKVCWGLALSCLVGAIAACNSGSETVEETATPSQPSTPEETTSSSEQGTPPSETATQPDETTESAETPATSETTTSTTTTAQSQTTPVPPLPAECSNPQTQADMNRCTQAEYEQADANLNNAYQAVKGAVSSQQQTQLLSAEEAWLTYRDINCDFVQAQYAGGSIQPTVYYGCLTQLTNDRTAELEQTKQASMSYEAADQELNSVYQSLQDYLSSEEQELLTDAQLAWIDYRDLHCAFEGGDTDTCLAQVTETRAGQLQEQLDTRSL
ncbi:MAG: DUF1311 domain-containing protein [Leptolyngbya sp. SIO1D8]|nr:DUF1311 domain-containing protein [Leptolyngbya sp. SIO1D8]